MGNAVADPENGMMGEDLNPLMTSLCKNWLECGKNLVGHTSNVMSTLVKKSTAMVFGDTLTMRQGVLKATLHKLYKDATKSTLTSCPSFLETPKPSVYCEHCHMVFSGTDDITPQLIRSFHHTLVDLRKIELTRVCPKNSDARCCDSLVTGKIYTDYEVLTE